VGDPNDVTIPQPLVSGATDQPNAPQSGQPQAAPPVPEGFSDTPVSSAPAAPAVPAGFSDTPQTQDNPNSVDHHGLLSRAWDWLNKPIADNVMPKDMKTADIMKALAYEKLFGKPYIPGVNDFDTAEEQHLGESPTRHALKTFIAGAAKDTANMAAGFTSPLQAGLMATGAGEAGLLGKTAATIAKPVGALAGTAFAGAGAAQSYQAVKDAVTNGLTPENTQQGLMGASMIAGGTAGAIKGVSPAISKIAGSLRPTTETVGSTEVPVRGTGLLARLAQKTVPDTMSRFAKEQTGPAVAKGIGTVAKEAAGTEGVVSPDQHDRLGIRGVADEVADRSKAVFQKLDEVSGNMLSEAQTMADDASGDYSSAGRKEYRQAMDLQDAIFDNYKNHSELQGMDLDQAKADWRQQVALREISKKLTGGTEASESGAQDYQFKQGKQLAESVDSLVKNDKDVLQRAGFNEDHIDQLQKFGRIIREQGNTPKFSGYMGGIAKALAGLTGAHFQGAGGALGGVVAETAAEHAGGWLADRMLGKVLTTPAALPILTEGLSKNIDPAIVTNQLKSAIATADPGWAAKTGEILSNLWHDESGNLTIPGTGQTVGTAEGAKADTAFFQQAKDELGEDASFSDVAKRAQEMKTQANLSGPGAEGAGSVEAINRANTEKAQGVKRVVVDTRTGQERPLIGVDAVDYQAKPYESVEFRGGDRDGEIIDQGRSARAYERKYSGEERRGIERKTMNAAELEDAMKNRKPIHTPFNDTEGAMATIARDQNMPKHPGERTVAEEAQAAAHHENGGSTFSPEGQNLNGVDKYSVGSYPERTEQSDILTPNSLKAFKDRNADLLNQPDHAVGTWKDTDTGKHVLDVAKLYDDRDAAIAAGQAANQKSIYHLGTGELVDTGGTGETPTGRVGQRKPTGKAEAGHDPSLNLGMDVINKAGADKPEYLQKLADKVAQYPTMKYAPEGADESFDPEAMATTDPHKILNNFVKQAADNIEWLHNQVPPDIREMSKNWYDSANKMTKDQAEKYGISHPQAAAVTAVLSPQNPWDNNISLANRVLDVWKNRQNFKWSPEMSKKAASLLGQSKNIDDALELIHGKTFAQLKDADPETEAAMKGLWTRIYDEAHNPRTFERWAPDGTTRGIARNAGGSPANASWFSILPISKAISVLEDGSMDNIHEQLGDAHKVRNFYNNIIDPNSKMGDTTVDTHAVGVAHLSPYSLDAQEVKDNFGGSSHKNAKFGLKGTYPLYAEAYKQAADRLGILPRQLQSITWEGIRSLFKDKSPELQGAVRDIWKDHQDGNITIDDARKRIIEAAGGFKPTDWQSDIGANEEAEQPANATGVPRTGVSQEEPQTQSRGRSRTSGAVSTSGNRQSQIENVYKAVTGGK
jgi:hypothetical protein